MISITFAPLYEKERITVLQVDEFDHDASIGAVKAYIYIS